MTQTLKMLSIAVLVVGCGATSGTRPEARAIGPKVAPESPAAAQTADAGVQREVSDYLAGLDNGPRPLLAAADSEDLAKKTQNPVADLISVPLQSNFNFKVGPNDDPQWVLNIQPVIPITINEDWNLITRTILPVVNQPVPAPGFSSDFGFGDTLFTAFLSPKNSGKVTWGAGPAILLPTSTSSSLGAGEWGAGLSAVALVSDGPWVVGALVSNVWSFEGAVNVFTLQPFVNYNLKSGWYLTTSPVITANWEATSSQRWTLPIGVGAGKIVRFGKLPVNISLHAYYNLEHPNFGPAWTIRFQLQFLFPK